MITFRDPIHGDLVFEGVLEDLIKTEDFQRLSEVKQLGLTDKVFPGANQTRFSHSLGVCFLAGELAKRLKIPKEGIMMIQAAALLHDIGHFDFSHALERFAPYNHEENGSRIILGKNGNKEVRAVLSRHGIDPKDIVNLLSKKGGFPRYYYEILSSVIIDVDRMDYLKRDTYYTGAMIGEIDISRLLSMLVVDKKTNGLGIQQKGLAALEQFLVARVHMYQQVYLHPDTEIGETMLRKAVKDSFDVAKPLMYGDGHLIARLSEKGTPLTKRLIKSIRTGKRAYYEAAISIDDLNCNSTMKECAMMAFQIEWTNPGSVERTLIKKAGLKNGELLVSFPASTKKYVTPPDFRVQLNNGGWEDIFRISTLTNIAMNEKISKTIFAVYAPKSKSDVVRKAATGYLLSLKRYQRQDKCE